ncbi:MAG: ferredoxin [Planctomycetota bacterium]
MAVIHPLNAPGKYWIDCRQCDDYGCCEMSAPNNFRRDELHEFVFKQPETEEEERQCAEAMLSCPANAIHCDGPQPPVDEYFRKELEKLQNDQEKEILSARCDTEM